MLSNPGKATKSNLAGIAYVLSRMEWYNAASEFLLIDDGLEAGDKSFEAVLKTLKADIVGLYKSLLLYQMKSVCWYYQNQGWVFLRSLSGLTNWDTDLESVKAAEDTLRKDSEQYNGIHVRTTLSETLQAAKGMERLLGDINENIRQLISTQQMMKRDEEETKCLQALRVVNPQDDMARIEGEKETLRYDVCEWIFHSESYVSFTTWSESELLPCRLLWIKGPAGTGKTMLTMGIIQKLSDQSAALSPSISYFFCQGTGAAKRNSVTAALKSLLWMLLLQQPKLISHLKAEYKYSGAGLFEDGNEFYALKRILEKMLHDPGLAEAYLIVDALDEFDESKPGLDELLGLISSSLLVCKKIKWLLTSRPEVDISERIKSMTINALDTTQAMVELDNERLANPIHAYIDYNISTLKGRRGYDQITLDKLSEEVHRRAGDNFLWVFLVFSDLKKSSGKFAVRTVQEYPSGLPELYGHKMAKLETGSRQMEYCRDVLTATALAFRPLSLSELDGLFSWSSDLDPYGVVKECSSFLTIIGEIVSLTHQSAKDFLTKTWLQYAELAEAHAKICTQSLQAMSSILQYNMYDITHDTQVKDVAASEPDLLDPIRYHCVFWVDHLFHSIKSDRLLVDNAAVLHFLSVNFLYWMESLSLVRMVVEGCLSLQNLVQAIQVWFIACDTHIQLLTFLESHNQPSTG
jgi:hypothetical protein